MNICGPLVLEINIPWEPKPAEILGFEKYLRFSDKTRGILTHSESTGYVRVYGLGTG